MVISRECRRHHMAHGPKAAGVPRCASVIALRIAEVVGTVEQLEFP